MGPNILNANNLVSKGVCKNMYVEIYKKQWFLPEIQYICNHLDPMHEGVKSYKYHTYSEKSVDIKEAYQFPLTEAHRPRKE